MPQKWNDKKEMPKGGMLESSLLFLCWSLAGCLNLCELFLLFWTTVSFMKTKGLKLDSPKSSSMFLTL